MITIFESLDRGFTEHFSSQCISVPHICILPSNGRSKVESFRSKWASIELRWNEQVGSSTSVLYDTKQLHILTQDMNWHQIV